MLQGDCCIMKRVVALIWRVILLFLSMIVFLFSVGTVIPAFPVVGSVANIVTVGFLHLWLPLCIALVLLSLFPAVRRGGKTAYRLALVFSCISLAATILFLNGNAAVLKQHGVRPNVFLSKEDVSSVTVESFPYTESEYGDVYLNVYHTEDGKTGKPVMIYIHGGGWIQGSREDHSYYSRAFARHGYVVFSVDYDLSSPERHLAETTERQITEAFAWVKNHAPEFDADITRLYVTGGSAGGNLALELSYKINAGIYQTAADGTALPAVKAVSVTFPVASVESFYRNNDPVLGGTAFKMASSYTGCSPEENPALFESLEPIHFITPDAPATSILVGATDTLVPPDATYELDEALEMNSIAHQTIVIPYANHIFDMVDGNMMNSAYLQLSLGWFDRFS